MPWATECAQLYRGLNDWTGLGLAVAAEFHGAAARGDVARANAILDEAERYLRRDGAPWTLALLLTFRAGIAQLAGDYARAAAACRESIALAARVGDIIALLIGLTGLAGALTMRREGVRAARLFGAVAALQERSAAFVQNPANSVLYDRHVAALRAQLAPEAFAAAWELGRDLSLDEAIAEALATDDKSVARSPCWSR